MYFNIIIMIISIIYVELLTRTMASKEKRPEDEFSQCQTDTVSLHHVMIEYGELQTFIIMISFGWGINVSLISPVI